MTSNAAFWARFVSKTLLLMQRLQWNTRELEHKMVDASPPPAASGAALPEPGQRGGHPAVLIERPYQGQTTSLFQP